MDADIGSAGATPPPFYDDLDLTLAEAWRLLTDAAKDAKADARAFTLATVGAEGAPEARTVILRAVAPEERTLVFHTDTRSAKVRELRLQPLATAHVYDRSREIQLRLRCIATVHVDDAVAGAAWSETPDVSRLYYRVTDTPGATVADPAAVVFDAETTRDGEANFAVVRLAVREIEWLFLHRRGHRRALFAWTGDDWRKTWQAP